MRPVNFDITYLTHLGVEPIGHVVNLFRSISRLIMPLGQSMG